MNGPARPTAWHSIIADNSITPGAIVWVPFPFVETPRMRERPALVVGALSPAAGIELLWVLMITSAANKGWRGDVSLEQSYRECGLGVPCVIRTAKLTTVEAHRARQAGRLAESLLAEVRDELRLKML